MDDLPPDAVSVQFAQEIAAAQLEHAARQFATVMAQIPTGDATQVELATRRSALWRAAFAYCAAHGHPGSEPPALHGSLTEPD